MSKCNHGNQRLVFRVFSNGVKHYGKQCQECGRIESVKKDSIHHRERAILPEFDESIRDAHYEKQNQENKLKWEQNRAVWQAERDEKNTKWWRAYQEHLRSAAWRDKRQRVLERDKYMCQACLKRKATIAHHLTYKHVLNEPLFDLVAVCQTCHDALHQETP